MAERKEVSSWMYVERNHFLTEAQMEVIKGSVCALSKETQCSIQYSRGINYCVIGLSQPRYVMLNLVAKSTREKGEKKVQITVKCTIYLQV